MPLETFPNEWKLPEWIYSAVYGESLRSNRSEDEVVEALFVRHFGQFIWASIRLDIPEEITA